MRCPILTELPQSPQNKTGWPWTEESPQLPDTMPDGSPWPKISIVTPSYNQGRFIEETIRSVLLQGYPNLEYMIFDGGSSDNSVEVIQKYANWLTYWTSEPDRGQAHAINKGFDRATGSLLAWINSDDLYLPGALKSFAEHHMMSPRSILLGDVENFVEGENRFIVIEQFNVSFINIVTPNSAAWGWEQQGMFVPSALKSEVGLLNEDLQYAFDLDWLLRLLQRSDVSYLRKTVARFRFQDNSKTISQGPAFRMEVNYLLEEKYWKMVPDLDINYAKARSNLNLARVYLVYHPENKLHWNRCEGIQYLIKACRLSPKILIHKDFLKLCRRAFLPKCLLRSSPWSKQRNA